MVKTKKEQKHATKNNVRFHIHLPLLHVNVALAPIFPRSRKFLKTETIWTVLTDLCSPVLCFVVQMLGPDPYLGLKKDNYS